MQAKDTIEKGVPLVTRAGIAHPHSISPVLSQMAVGDSFVTDRNPSTLYSLAYRAGLKIAIRKLKEGGHRVWLVGFFSERVSPSPSPTPPSTTPSQKNIENKDSAAELELGLPRISKAKASDPKLVKVFFSETLHLPESDASWFWSKMLATGWCVNGKTIRSWKHLAHSWAQMADTGRPIFPSHIKAQSERNQQLWTQTNTNRR